MSLPNHLAELIEVARHAVPEAGRHLAPSIPVRRAAWALAEISGKIQPDPESETALREAHHALDALLARANDGLLFVTGLEAEQAEALAALDAVQAALARARPNATAIALGLDG